MENLLKTKGTKIVANNGESVFLKGINLGGWLLMEAYILYSPNIPEKVFKKEFVAKLGKRSLDIFEDNFRKHFINENDIKNIASHGFN